MSKYKAKIAIIRPNMLLQELVTTIEADSVVSAFTALLIGQKDRGLVQSISLVNLTLKKEREKFIKEDYQ